MTLSLCATWHTRPQRAGGSPDGPESPGQVGKWGASPFSQGPAFAPQTDVAPIARDRAVPERSTHVSMEPVVAL